MAVLFGRRLRGVVWVEISLTFLSFYRLMDLCPIDFPIYIYIIRKDLYILCFKRSQVEISKF